MYRFAALQGRQDQTFEETVLVAPAIREITTLLKKIPKILNHKRRTVGQDQKFCKLKSIEALFSKNINDFKKSKGGTL